MKRIDFYFQPFSIDAAADYLIEEKASPIQGMEKDEIIDLVKSSTVTSFNKKYKEAIVQPDGIDGAHLHGAIVWKGLCCIFRSVEIASGEPCSIETEIHKDSPQQLHSVVVNYLKNLG